MDREAKFDSLPADCVANVLSFTSPVDTGRASIVSSTVHAAANSDGLWEKLLPPYYEEILTRSTSPVPKFDSKKELFLWLCSPLLLDGGKKVFYLDKLTGKKCYMIAARELTMMFGDDPLYWSWKPFLQSRFGEVAELVATWWLEINGSIQTQMLSPDTSYVVYLVFKFSNGAYGLDSIPAEGSVEVGDHRSGGEAQLSSPDSGIENMILPCEREDGWLEIWLGEFKTNGYGCDNEEVKMSFKDIEGTHLKSGLFVEGIEIRLNK